MARKTMGDNNNLKLRPSINVGATIDVPTGTIVTGTRGESIINGGLSSVEGFTGLGNNFKSTLMHFMMVTAAERIEAGLPNMTTLHTYDTENNMSLNLDRINSLGNQYTKYLPNDLLDNDIWTIKTKAEVDGVEWYRNVFTKHINEKMVEKGATVEYEAFNDKRTGGPLKLLYPTFAEIDSLTELEGDGTMDMLEKNDIEKTNMMYMQQGNLKAKILKDMPRLTHKGNVNLLLTTHLGGKIDMSSNPYSKPTKDLQYMKQDENIKGGTSKLFFLTTHLWKAFGATALINQGTKGPEYPLYEDDLANDLNIVKMMQFRSKTGQSGYTLEIVISQNEGVIPYLTEFHNLKKSKYGIDGNPRTFHLSLVPDVNLGRTTVRRKLKNDIKLQRAVNILSEIAQYKEFKPVYGSLFCTGEELYKDIKELGYDWDILLQTRGWWAIKQYSKDIPPFLSSMDILKMRKGLYHPYWMDKDKKVKKEWAKHFNIEKNKIDKKEDVNE